MRKYIESAKLMFKIQLAYRFDILSTALIAVARILFAMIVWGAVFGTRAEVGGFTLPAMISYYIVSSLLAQLDKSEGISGEVSTRIRNGTFSKYMVVPVRVEGYFRWQTFGAAAMYGIFNLLAVALWTALFGLDLTLTRDAVTFLGALAMLGMGLVFMTQLNFFLGILTFKFEDISNFLMIKDNLVEFVTGTMVPLALLPAAVVSVMRLLPFYYVVYLPAMLLIGQGREEMATGLLVLLGWVLAFAVINRVSYGHLRRKYEGVGI